MGGVESVRFHLVRDGAPVFIDDLESIAIDEITGTVTVPDEAEALIKVTIDGNLSTNLGAIASAGETLLSNPVTGVFEPLPAGYDLDPRSFFDPVGGWQPLIGGLVDVVLVGEEDRGGLRYHVRGTAPADRIEAVTAGLVRGQEVVVDLWVHPVTALVTAVEFDTVLGDGTTSWALELSEYNGVAPATGRSATTTALIALGALGAVGLAVAIVRPLVTAGGGTTATAHSPGPIPVAAPSTVERVGRASPRAVLIAVAFSVFVAADDLTVVTTMLRPIIGDLGLVLPDGLDDAAWIVNVYLIAFVAVMPIAGRLSDVIGRRNTFAGAYVIFLIGTTLIPLTDSLGPFLMARVLTAIGGGAMVPVALAVVADVYPDAKRARALGTLAAIETLGWVWGPMYGAILVRFLSWEWQFWLNIPFALAGLGAVWWALSGHDQGPRASRVDWRGAVLLTTALVSLNLALLGDAEIQSVTGFDQLTGGDGFNFRWLYLLALVTGGLFVWHQRIADDPLIDRSVFKGRNLQVALAVNFIVGASLIISMVDVPIFINAVEVDIEDSAVAAGWVLSALTAAMAVASYAGGRMTARSGYRLPIVLGMGAAVVAYVVMGVTWEADTSYWVLGAQLGVLGAGLGLVTAPTSSAVIDATEAGKRGSAAATLMVVRLMGLSVGLSLLTAWGLSRFNTLRGDIDLPAITDAGFQDAVVEAQGTLTAQAIAETFLAAAGITAIGFLLAFLIKNKSDPALVDSPGTVGVGASEPRVARVEIPEGWERNAPDVTQELESVTAFAAEETAQFEREMGVPMSWLQRHSGVVVGALGALVALAFVLIAVMFGQLNDTKDELVQTQEDLTRVEAGAALFASQVTGFQEQIVALEPTIGAGLDEAVAGLEEFATSTIDFVVNIDEEVTIETHVVLDRELQIPINETLPIKETFETRIEVETPLGFSIPLDVTVPVDIDVPIDLELDIVVNETIPVSATVPVKFDIPISLEVSETQLADLAASLAEGLEALKEVLVGLGG
jgi:MFS family permease